MQIHYSRTIASSVSYINKSEHRWQQFKQCTLRFIRTSTNSSSVQSDGDNVLYALDNSNYTIALLQRSIRKCFSVNSFPNLALFGFASEEKKNTKNMLYLFFFFFFGKALATFIGRLHKSFVHAVSNYIATGKRALCFLKN